MAVNRENRGQRSGDLASIVNSKREATGLTQQKRADVGLSVGMIRDIEQKQPAEPVTAMNSGILSRLSVRWQSSAMAFQC